MRAFLAFFVIAFASGVLAHPFDEVEPVISLRVYQASQIVELQYIFKYTTIASSRQEQQNGLLGLDTNADGVITRNEQAARIKQYVEEVCAQAVVLLDDKPVALKSIADESWVVNASVPGADIEQVGDWLVAYGLILRSERQERMSQGTHTITFHNSDSRITRSLKLDRSIHCFTEKRRVGQALAELVSPLSITFDTVDGRFDRVSFAFEGEGPASGNGNTVEPLVPAKPLSPEEIEAARRASAIAALASLPKREETVNEQSDRLLQRWLGDIEGGGFAAVLAVLFIFFYGMWHAVQPGHGKTLVAGYLIGSHGHPRDALILGLTVTLAHTSGVFLLLFLWLALEWFYPELNRAKIAQDIIVTGVGATVFLMGVGLLLRRTRGAAHRHDALGRHVGEDSHEHDHTHECEHHHEHDHHEHSHSHDHGHDHDHGHKHTHDHAEHQHSHSHDHDHDDSHHHTHVHAHNHDDHGHAHGRADGKRLSTWEVIRLGIVGGLLPCPSAFTLALITIMAGKALLGLFLILVFSAGLALVLSGIGLAMVSTKGYLQARMGESGRLRRLMESHIPTLGALAVTLIGFVLVLAAFQRFGLIDINTLII